ncbi:MAG: glutamate--cysteine ligase [Deltaproteobacteria bacterium]|nr:glutamate--cysteine ligase [Deltaproteobacteria bacterium]
MSLDKRAGDSPPVRGPGDLVDWFRARERPPEEWKVGLEHEKVLLRAGTVEPVPYGGPGGVEAVLRGFVEQGYEPVEDEGRIIAAQHAGLTVSIEPGGQIELSGRPFQDVHVVAAELDRHRKKCEALAERLGVTFLATGYRPWGTPRSSPWMPKSRYRVMRPFLAARGRLAEDMMAMTGSGQASFDFGSEPDAGEKLRLALAAQPAVTALYANSPIVNGAPWGGRSFRVQVWEETDPARCGLLPFAFEEGFQDSAYRRYVEWALDVPMVFLRREGRYLETGARTFRAFLAEGLGGERPTMADWEDHLSCLFPDVRLKGVVEVRGADACDMEMTKALAAFWKGLLYDRGARLEAWEEVRGLDLAARRQAVKDAGRQALAAPWPRGGTLGQLAGRLLAISAEGLCRQNCCGEKGEDERHWLDPLRERALSGRSPADEALEAFERGGDRALVAKLRCA